MKHEIRVEFDNSEILKDLIDKVYFEDGYLGKISGDKKSYLKIDESNIVLHTTFKGLNNATVKITNDIVDGCMRFVIDENSEEIRIYPISIYCIKEDKYIFY
jgi:hypothetical protein